jgi:hypothetical protein
MGFVIIIRIYDYLQQNCLPESTHKNDNGDCEDDWEAVYVIDSDLLYSGALYRH